MLGHNAGAATKEGPGHQRTKQCVTDTGPGGGNAVFPTELTGVAYKNNGGEIGSAVSKSGEPGAYISAAKYKAINVGGMFAAIQTNTNSNTKEYD